MKLAWKDDYLKSMIKENRFIDKTQELEKGIRGFPSVFIEGAAASGKTVAVQMFLFKHPEMVPVYFLMDEERSEDLLEEKLESIQKRMENEKVCVVFENINQKLTVGFAGKLAAFLEQMPENGKAFLLGREKPSEELLTLLWKRKMELISQSSLNFSAEEIAGMAEIYKSGLNSEEVYQETGGWAGCVDLMIRLSLQNPQKTAADLMKQYEIRTYISREILGSLEEKEEEILRRAAVCPWLNEDICTEVWDLRWAGEAMENLERKGFLCRAGREDHRKLAPMFRSNIRYEKEAEKQSHPFWKRLGSWYENHNYIKEMLYCLDKSGDEAAYKEGLLRHYEKIPFLEIPYDQVMEWKEITPEICYLRGMYCYYHQNFAGLDKEIYKVEKLQPFTGKVREVYINLTFVKPDLTLDDWLTLLKKYGDVEAPIRLYNILGGSCTFLCGLRDLSGMFACSKKDEKRKARIWKEYLHKNTWPWLQFARMDYYVEIGREKEIEDQENRQFFTGGGYFQKEDQLNLARLYLFYRCGTDGNKDDYMSKIKDLEKSLLKSDSLLCREKVKAVRMFYFSWLEDGNRIIRRIQEAEINMDVEISEENYLLYWNLSRVFFLVKQYDKAEKILRKLIPYFVSYHRIRFLTEALFVQAMTDWEKGNHSKALRYMLESFGRNGAYRYVRLYIDYGNRGREVLNAYVEWMKKNSPEGWHRKKKYNYGNVRNMPVEDYLELLLRASKHQYRTVPENDYKLPEEHLTMMETVILQNIGRGKTNAEICEELNLKLSTVKSHIYSLYKKMGVNTRIQATLKGKEMGVLK